MRALPIPLVLTLSLAPLAAEEAPRTKAESAPAEKKEGARKPKKSLAKGEAGFQDEVATGDKAGKGEKAALPEPPRPDPEKTRQARRIRDQDAALKRLERENAQLRKELAERVEASPALPGSESATPEGALAELRAGNGRFAAGTRTRSQMGANDPALRLALAKGQAPFAVIVTCSDSRLADNFIFDQELGRLFTVREAGNCPDFQGIASVEYAVEHLGAKAVVVLGHGSCGAVKAVMESGSRPLPGNLWSFQAAMAGLLESVRHDPNENPAEHLGHLVEANARRQAAVLLDRSEIIRRLAGDGKLAVVPAVYDLASGRVAFLPSPAREVEAPAPR